MSLRIWDLVLAVIGNLIWVLRGFEKRFLFWVFEVCFEIGICGFYELGCVCLCSVLCIVCVSCVLCTELTEK